MEIRKETGVVLTILLAQAMSAGLVLECCRWRHTKRPQPIAAVAPRLAARDSGCSAAAENEQEGGSLDDQLRTAMYQGNRDDARELLAKGANVNGPDCDNKYEWEAVPLTQAAEKGDMAMVRLLVTHGARVDPPVMTNETPLMAAAACGDNDTVRFLLAHGAKVAGCNRFGSALSYAARTGHLTVAKTLVKAGADVNLRDTYATVLHGAAESGSSETVRYLLRCGANPKAEGKYGSLPLNDAAKAGSVECVSALLEAGTNIDHCAPYSGGTALMVASKQGDADMVRFLLRRGANPNIRAKEDADGAEVMTALKSARKNGHSDIVKMLKRAGAKE